MLVPGLMLQSNSTDDYFKGSRICLTVVNQEGCIGLIYNKRFPRTFNELVEFADSPPFPLQEGGPVEQEKLFLVHRRPDLIEGGQPIGNELFLNGDFKAAVAYLNIGMLDQSDMKFFIGYCGWDPGQLESEIQAGDWTILSTADFFDSPNQ